MFVMKSKISENGKFYLNFYTNPPFYKNKLFE